MVDELFIFEDVTGEQDTICIEAEGETHMDAFNKAKATLYEEFENPENYGHTATYPANDYGFDIIDTMGLDVF